MNIIRLTFGTLLLSLGCAHSHSLESIVELGAKYEAHGQKEKAVLLYEEALQRETPTQNHLHLGIYYYELAKLSDDAFQSREYLEKAVDHLSYGGIENHWYSQAVDLLITTYNRFLKIYPEQEFYRQRLQQLQRIKH